MSGCCPYSDPNLYGERVNNSDDSKPAESRSADSHGVGGTGSSRTGTGSSNCALNKPLSEWTKLETKLQCDAKKWVPMPSKGQVAACNPNQLSALHAMRDSIERSARNKNSTALSWEQFNGGALGTYNNAEQLAAQTAKSGSFVLLRQADFAQGTVRLRAGGYFRLAENIVFEPNADVATAIRRYAPTEIQRTNGGLYSDSAYTRDFFAVVTIEAENVYLDLAGFSISQSVLFQTAQRFSSVIELADQPFPPAQGPGNFGSVVTPAVNAVVANGTIGLSSHHGIHGNNCKSILLESLTIRDYEFAGIAINFGENCAINKCDLLGNLQTLKFNHRLSAAIFGLRDAARIIAIAVESGASTSGDPAVFGTPANIFNLLSQYFAALTTTVTPIIDTGDIASDHDFATKPCAQKNGNVVKVIDGTAYGILFNSFGIAINGFDEDAQSESSKALDSREILICDTKVSNHIANFEEMPAFFDTRTATKGPQVDTTGQLINLSLLYDCNFARFGIVGNSPFQQLARLQIAVVYMRNLIAAFDPTYNLGIFRVGRVASEFFPLINPVQTFVQCSSLTDFVWKRNADSMFHVGKGCIGMKLDGIWQLCVRDVQIDVVENCGEKAIVCPLPCENNAFQIDLDVPANCCALNVSGEFLEPLKRSPYTGPTNGGHPMQGANIIGYGGADSFGVTVSAVSHFNFSNVSVSNVVSKYGSAVGFLVQCQSNHGKISCTKINQVHAAVGANPVDFTQGAKAPIGNGIRVDTSSQKLQIDKPVITNVDATGYAACKMCINSTEVAVTI